MTAIAFVIFAILALGHLDIRASARMEMIPMDQCKDIAQFGIENKERGDIDMGMSEVSRSKFLTNQKHLLNCIFHFSMLQK